MQNAALKKKTVELAPDLGLRQEQRRELAEKLGDALADAFRLSFNLLGLHWNVEGPTFYGVHKLTEKQYKTVEESVDDDLPKDADLKQRIDRTVTDFEAAGQRLKSIVALAEGNGDITTADLLTRQLASYEEFGWMMRSTAS